MFITQREFLPGEEAPWIEEERRQLADVALRALQAYAVAAWARAAPSFLPPCGQGDDSSGWLRSTRADTRSSCRRWPARATSPRP